MILNNVEQTYLLGNTRQTTLPGSLTVRRLPTVVPSFPVISANVGPVGVLLTPFVSIEQARNLGGLLITDLIGTWWFAVGYDLDDYVSRGAVNSHAVENGADNSTRFITKLDVDSGAGFKSSHMGANYGFELASFVSRPNPLPGQVVNGNMYMFAIVTGAQSGFGSKTVTAGRWSFMNTVRNMDVPVRAFIEANRQVVINAAPSDIRDYVARSYPRAMATWPHAGRVGSIGCASAWLDGVQSDVIPSAKPLYVQPTRAALSGATTLNTLGDAVAGIGNVPSLLGSVLSRQGFWSGVNIWSGGRVLADYTFSGQPKDVTDEAGVDTWYNDAKPSMTIQRSPLWYLGPSADGFATPPPYTGYVNFRTTTVGALFDAASATVPVLRGSSKGYGFTALRAGHVLGHTMTRGDNSGVNGTVANAETGLSSHMKASFDAVELKNGLLSTDASASWLREYALDVAVTVNKANINVIPYDRGTFRELVMLFNAHWDKETEALARAEN